MAKKNVLNHQVVQTTKKYAQLLKEQKIPYKQLIVFGSQAKGNATIHSDIDLCVVSDKFGKNRHTERVKLMHARKHLFNIEPHPFHPKELKNKWDPLAQEIRHHGIRIS